MNKRKLLVLDWNTWNQIPVFKLFPLSIFVEVIIVYEVIIIIISYLKPYEWVQIIAVRLEYWKPYNCLQKIWPWY